MRDIKKIDILVHPFYEINKIINSNEEKILTYKYNKNYKKEHENIMKERYTKSISEICSNKDGFLILVPYTQMISKGIAHDNVIELYNFLDENYYGSFKVMDISVNPNDEIFNNLKNNKENLKISCYGEYTSGCVLNDLLRTYEALEINADLNLVLDSLKPEKGVDINYGYPRIWENIIPEINIMKKNTFKNIVKHNYDYYHGKNNLPIYEIV
jgi:hypothetical protein